MRKPSLIGIIVIDIIWLLVIFVTGFSSVRVNFQYGSFVLACCNIGFLLRFYLASREEQQPKP